MTHSPTRLASVGHPGHKAAPVGVGRKVPFLRGWNAGPGVAPKPGSACLSCSPQAGICVGTGQPWEVDLGGLLCSYLMQGQPCPRGCSGPQHQAWQERGRSSPAGQAQVPGPPLIPHFVCNKGPVAKVCGPGTCIHGEWGCVRVCGDLTPEHRCLTSATHLVTEDQTVVWLRLSWPAQVLEGPLCAEPVTLCAFRSRSQVSGMKCARPEPALLSACHRRGAVLISGRAGWSLGRRGSRVVLSTHPGS